MSTTSAAPSPTPSTPDVIPSDANVSETEIISSWAILIVVSLLLVVFFTSYFLQRWRIRILHESVVAIILGMIAGLTIRLSGSEDIQKMVTFDHRYFFNLLLPPIILNSGYDLKVKHFFRNLGSILVFAFAGTFISAVVIGLSVSLMVVLGMGSLKIDVHGVPDVWVYSFLDGSRYVVMLDSLGVNVPSPTAVTVLAIFNQLKVDPTLYAIIFGESMLNDAVAIVLYGTLDRLREAKGENGFGMAIGGFLAVFMGSFAIGVSVALLTALILKHTDLHRFPSMESCIVFLLAYSTYLLSNAIQMSGIVSLLFCGMTMKHYMYPNLSLRSQRTTRYMFQVMAHLSENFIFIYLGLTLFTRQDEVFRFWLILFTFVTILLARAASVFPLAYLVNYFIEAHQIGFQRRLKMGLRMDPSIHVIDTIPQSHQIMLWWAGLRGAIAFALSMDIATPSASELRTTTLIVVVLSILIFGGTTATALKRLHIQLGVDDEEEDSADSPSTERKLSDSFMVPGTPFSPPPSEEHWFVSFDNKYLAPLFSRTNWKHSEGRHAYQSTAGHDERLQRVSVESLGSPPAAGELGEVKSKSGHVKLFDLGDVMPLEPVEVTAIPPPPSRASGSKKSEDKAVRGSKKSEDKSVRRSPSPVRRRQWDD